MFKVCVSNSFLLKYHSHSCMCATLGFRVGTVCSDSEVGGVRAVSGRLSEVEVILEVGRATGCDTPRTCVTPPSVCVQYLALSCWARSLSPTGGLSRASVRMFQVGGGLVHFNQTVSISSRRSVIGRFSLRMHLRVSIGTCNCTPRENHLSATGCSSQCRDFRSS